MTLSLFLNFTPVVLAWYQAGFSVLAPPLAWGGLATGYWLNRGNPLASKLAGMLLAAVAGAVVAQTWHYCAVLNPGVDAGMLLTRTVGELARPAVSAFTSGGQAASVAVAVVFYAPLVVGLVLCILAARHEDALAGGLGRLREAAAERRAARKAARTARVERRLAAQRDAVMARLPAGPAEAEEMPRFNFDKARAPVVLDAQSGEAVALPAELTGDKAVVIVVKVAAPSPVPVRLGQGRLVGLCVALYYLAATMTKLWLPLTLVALWLFWAPLLSFVEQQAIDTGTQIGTKVWNKVRPF